MPLNRDLFPVSEVTRTTTMGIHSNYVVSHIIKPGGIGILVKLSNGRMAVTFPF